MASAYAFVSVTDDSGYSSSTSALVLHVFHSTPVASENMDVLYDNMSLPDLIERAGIEAVKQVMGKNLTDERIGEIRDKCRL